MSNAPFRQKLFYVIAMVTSLIVGYGVYLSRTDLVSFESWYVREDGLVEWLSVVALVFSASICLYRIPILKPFRSKFFILCLGLQALVFLFGAGEEISWGQRIFDRTPGEFFYRYNSQGETNLHNLVIGGRSINKLIFGTFLGIVIASYFLILPLLYLKVKKIQYWVNQLGLALPHYGHIGLYLGLMGLIQMAQGHRTGELVEFTGVWVFVTVLLFPLNKEVFSRKLLER